MIQNGISAYWAGKAEEFHKRNPHILVELTEMALRMRARGKKKYGIKVLYNALRWKVDLETEDDTPYRLNDAYHAWYARKIMADNWELRGFFDLRERDWTK